MSELRAVTHNVYVGQDPDDLRANLTKLAEATDHPHAMALQEARRLRRPIHGYQRIAVEWPSHPDDLGCQLLVRDDVHVHRPRLLPVGGPWWTGPHGLRHPPKVFVGATLGVDGRRWDVLSVHRVWTGDGRRNTETWEAEHDALESWLLARARREHGTRPVVPLGDWNGRTSDRWANSISQLARQTDGQLSMRGIDGALSINVARVRARELERLYGSDGHHPVALTLVAPT